MRERMRSHLTYANVMATLAVFLVLGGGTALASYVVSSNSQIGPGTIAGHAASGGKHSNIIAGTVNSKDVTDNSLDSSDLKNGGVDTCRNTFTARIGQFCAGSNGASGTWVNAVGYCSGLGLRLPTTGEAMSLAQRFNVPGVGGSQHFWTDDVSGGYAAVVSEAGDMQERPQSNGAQIVCANDPSA